LRYAIDEYEAGRLTKEGAQKWVIENSKAWPFDKGEEEYSEI
jgi:hypothetical protein